MITVLRMTQKYLNINIRISISKMEVQMIFIVRKRV